MKKPAQALADLLEKKAKLKQREKQLKADLATYQAVESRKLRLAIGGYMVEHLTDPAIRRALNKVLPALRPDLRDKLSVLIAEAVGSKTTQAQISFTEPARPAAESSPEEHQSTAPAALSLPGT